MVELEPGRDHTTQAGSQGQGAPSLYLYCDAAALQSLRPLVVTYVASESTGSLSPRKEYSSNFKFKLKPALSA